MVVNITNKIQNIVLGLLVVLTAGVVFFTSSNKLSSNAENVTNIEYTKLIKDTSKVEDSVSRFFNSSLESIGQIYYDDRIKKSIFMRHTRLNNNYKQKASESLKDFAIFKGYKNILLFDPEFKLLGSVNRSISFTQDVLTSITNRLENFKENQVVLQKINGQNALAIILKLEYADGHYAYLVVVENLFESIVDLPGYNTDDAEYFMVSKTLDYKDSLLSINGENTPEHFYLKEDTLMKYSEFFSRSFNYEGKETVGKIQKLKEKQYSYILGLLKPESLALKIKDSEMVIKDYYFNYYILVGLLLLSYLSLVFSKVNLQRQFMNLLAYIAYRFDPERDKKKAGEALTKQIKKDAFSYAEKEASLKNTMFKAYSALKKMTPEDIRNLSIKNSLSKENIRLVYQPVVDAKTMQPQFCEVYLRLLNYYGEELMPSEFIPVLRHFNMLENLDEMMLEKVIKKIQSLQSTDSSAKISLNISSGAFNSDKFLKKLKSSFITGEISTENVMLEIPALEVINDEKSAEFIDDLTNYGVHFAVSISSLGNQTMKKILSHKIKYAKIDMSEFSNVLESEEKQKTLKQILTNSKNNGISIIAERIETELMFKLAKSLDIQLLQGYYIGKPKKYYTHK